MYTTKPPYPSILDLDSPYSQGLVGCWLMNEGSGLYARDISGQGNHGTLTNMAENDWVAEGLDFDGSNDCIIVSANSLLGGLPLTYNFTALVSAGAQSPAADDAVLSWGGGDDLVMYPYDSSTDKFRVFWRGIGGVIWYANHWLSGTGLNQFAFACCASNLQKYYVNGKSVGESSAIGSAGPFSTFHIAQYADGNSQRFLGQISHVQIYNRALSADEIASLYHDQYQMVWEPSETFYSFAASSGTIIKSARRGFLRGVLRGAIS